MCNVFISFLVSISLSCFGSIRHTQTHTHRTQRASAHIAEHVLWFLFYISSIELTANCFCGAWTFLALYFFFVSLSTHWINNFSIPLFTARLVSVSMYLWAIHVHFATAQWLCGCLSSTICRQCFKIHRHRTSDRFIQSLRLYQYLCKCLWVLFHT